MDVKELNEPVAVKTEIDEEPSSDHSSSEYVFPFIKETVYISRTVPGLQQNFQINIIVFVYLFYFGHILQTTTHSQKICARNKR